MSSLIILPVHYVHRERSLISDRENIALGVRRLRAHQWVL